MDPLEWLLSPIAINTFLDRHWEKEHLIIRRQSGYYDDLLTFADVNEFMARNDIRYPYLRLVKDGQELPLVDYADDFVYGANVFPGLLDNDKVFHHYASGATLSFQIFQKCMESLSSFCNALEARLRFQTQVNIFVTPPGSKGFTAHYDDHSFFIFQISGSKNWNLYGSPVELPLQEFRKEAKQPALGDPLKVTLNAGDMLYLPKGFYHEANTTTETSVHITLGIFPYTWIQIIEQLVGAAKLDVDYRRSPSRYLTGGIDTTLKSELDVLIERLKTIPLQTSMESLFSVAASKQITNSTDRLADLVALPTLTSVTLLRRRNVLTQINTEGQNMRLRFYDKSLSFPIATKRSLQFILENNEFTAAEIPGELDEPSKLLIVRKLIREGLLAIVGSNSFCRDGD